MQLFWKAGVDVPPPLLWPFWLRGIAVLVSWTIAYVAVERRGWRHPPGDGHALAMGLISGLICGAFIAIRAYRKVKRLQFSNWYAPTTLASA
jgi:Zn-dependent protease